MLSLEKFGLGLKELGINSTDKLLLAVSGGVDSMVLWHLMHRLSQSHGVAHVNFGLRAEESDKDQSLVEDLAGKYGVPVHIMRADTKNYAKKHQVSVQMAARNIRYQWFNELKQEHAYQGIVTAHHLNDGIETFFINLNRGTGLNGLKGIDSSRNLMRPLLSYSKEEIRDYAREQEVEFREDQSNAKLHYERNWFRHELIKPWEERNPEFLLTMKKTMDHLRVAKELLDSFLEESCVELRKELQKGFLSISTILQSKSPDQVLYYLLEPLEFNHSQCTQILKCLLGTQVGKKFNSNKYQLNIDRDKIFIERSNENTESESIKIGEEVQAIQAPMTLNFEEVDADRIELKSAQNIEYLNKEKLNYPLELRPWQEGDWMIPLGMKGKKKISDILIDEKIPLKDKSKFHVLCSNDSIVWLVGLRIDDRFKLKPNNKKALRIEWKKRK